MESEEDKKKLKDDLVEFVGKHTGAEVPKLAARLKSYVDMQNKRQRAEAARRHYHDKKESSASRKKTEGDPEDKTMENIDHPGNDKDRIGRSHGRQNGPPRTRSDTRSRSDGPSDRCGRRRRRRRRRRSCRRRRRRRRRRRSCRRRRRRRRRRSCSRRRRRRSCRRRRRRRRRRRC